MRALILTAAVLVAGATATEQTKAADRSHHQPAVHQGGDHGATITLASHRRHPRHHGPHHVRPHHRHHGPYHHHGPKPYYRYGCSRPVIVAPPAVYTYPYPYPYGYYYRGGVSVNTGRVGFSIAF